MLNKHIMKILNSSKINPFGGLNFVIEEFEKLGLSSILNQYLPHLPAQCKYNWKDIVYSFWSIYFCGGDSIEDISNNLKNKLDDNPVFNIPSPDRILDRFKELSLPQDVFTLPRGTSLHKFSLNPILAELILKIAHVNLDSKQSHILDYDNTIIFNNKSDSVSTYKRQNGYCPGVGIIDKTIVFIENRNGNSAAKDLQYHTLFRMFKELSKEQIKIDAFRADAASYQTDVIELVQKHSKRFFIRACMSQVLAKEIANIKKWEELKFGNEIAYRGEIIFTPFLNALKKKKKLNQARSYRLVITKIERKDRQINCFTKDAFLYSAIITNDYNLTKNEVVEFYNQRGAIEKEFDVLKNDFGWSNLPFSKLEQNTVFLYFSAICRNLYQYIITTFSQKYKGLNPKFRIKKFIFRFISIPCKWIKTSRELRLRVYGEIQLQT